MTSNNDKPLVKLIKTEKKDMTKYQKLIFRHNRYCTYEEIIRACYEKYHSSKFQTQMQWAKFLEKLTSLILIQKLEKLIDLQPLEKLNYPNLFVHRKVKPEVNSTESSVKIFKKKTIYAISHREKEESTRLT